MVTGSNCMRWTDTGAGGSSSLPPITTARRRSASRGVPDLLVVVDGSDGVSDQERLRLRRDRARPQHGRPDGLRRLPLVLGILERRQVLAADRLPGDLSGGQRPAFTGGGAISRRSSARPAARTASSSGTSSTRRRVTGRPVLGMVGRRAVATARGHRQHEPATTGEHTSGDNEAGGGSALSSLITYAVRTIPELYSRSMRANGLSCCVVLRLTGNPNPGGRVQAEHVNGGKGCADGGFARYQAVDRAGGSAGGARIGSAGDGAGARGHGRAGIWLRHRVMVGGGGGDRVRDRARSRVGRRGRGGGRPLAADPLPHG